MPKDAQSIINKDKYKQPLFKNERTEVNVLHQPLFNPPTISINPSFMSFGHSFDSKQFSGKKVNYNVDMVKKERRGEFEVNKEI